MKITNQGIDIVRTVLNRERADKECIICPTCGTHTINWYTSTVIEFNEYNNEILIRQDKFTCPKCGEQLQGKPYKVVKKK